VRRVFGVLVGIIAAAVVLPPLWYLVFPYESPPDLPPAGTRIELDGGIGMNVVEAGSGAPVVLAHGLPGSAYDWRELVPELSARGRRAIAYDRVGYGRSDPRANGRYTPSANAEELLGLLAALDLRDVTLVGWSYGGVTAMVAAMTDSSRLGRLVLIGTGGPDNPDAGPPELPGFMRFMNSRPVLRWRAAVPSTGVALMKLSSGLAFSGGKQPDWWLPGLRANMARTETVIAYVSEMGGIGADPASDADFTPETITLSTLLLHGDDDQLAPVAISRYLDTQIPNSKLVEYPGASHMLPVTHASQVAEQIVAF
jgi:pimeloyl-ACP methyl ester carboxylesterase